MVCGGTSASGVEDLVVDPEKYCQILIHHAIISVKCFIGTSLIFRHGSDPKHTAVKAYLHRKPHIDWLP